MFDIFNILMVTSWCLRVALVILILTRICVNHFHHSYVFAWVVVDLFQPWLEVYVCITYFIYNENKVFTGLLPLTLN